MSSISPSPDEKAQAQQAIQDLRRMLTGQLADFAVADGQHAISAVYALCRRLPLHRLEDVRDELVIEYGRSGPGESDYSTDYE